MKKYLLSIVMAIVALGASGADLKELQQKFVNERFGMFIHFNMPTFVNQDWPDPDQPAATFHPAKLDCSQWAEGARSAGMKFGCLTTKHHNGYCIWDTETTDYNCVDSGFGRDVVKEYTDAFRDAGLDVMLYFSILDTHHRIRPGYINPSHTDYIKRQLHELLTNYGPISAIIIDGWDAPWSRISYEEIPFDDIYHYIKQLQPDCLVMDLNAAKYPQDVLFYTDIKSFEQNAGQHISTDTNVLPALSCLPLNGAWFWKTDYPASDVKSPEWIVEENIIPFNEAYCTYILNVAPNTDGLIDDNAMEALAEIGRLWKGREGKDKMLTAAARPITAENIAKRRPAESSWSDDGSIMDYANDDNFGSAWVSNRCVAEPWYMVKLDRATPVNTVTLTDHNCSFDSYRLYYDADGKWVEIPVEPQPGKVKVHRFDPVTASAIKVTFHPTTEKMTLHEIGVYNQR